MQLDYDAMLAHQRERAAAGQTVATIETTTLIRLIEAAQSAEAHKASRADMLIKQANSEWQDKELPSSGIYTHDYGM